MLATLAAAEGPLQTMAATTGPRLSMLAARAIVRRLSARSIATVTASRPVALPDAAARYFPERSNKFSRDLCSSARSRAFHENFEVPKIQPPSAKIVGLLVAGGVTLYLANNSILMTDAGVTYVVQNNLTGTLDVYTEPGIHHRVPFFSTVTPYKQVSGKTPELECT